MTTKQHKPNSLTQLFTGLKSIILEIESSAIETVSAITPWLAPLIPAYLTHTHAIGVLKYPAEIALVTAVAVEFLGLAAVNTAIEFWQYNDTQAAKRESRIIGLPTDKADKARQRRHVDAPFAVALASGVFYLTVVLSVNVLLSLDQSALARVWANGLLSLLSVPAAIIIAIRSQHRRKTTEKARKTESVTESVADTGGQSKSAADSATVRPQTYAEYVSQSADRNGSGPLTPAELLEIGVPKSSAYEWPKRYAQTYALDVEK